MKLPEDRKEIAAHARCNPAAIRLEFTGRGMSWRIPVFPGGKKRAVLWVAQHDRHIEMTEDGLRGYKT